MTTAPDSDAGGAREVEVDEATIIVEGETFLYREGPSGICDPDWAGLGIVFRADMKRVDENGDLVPLPGQEGITQGAIFVFDYADPGGDDDQTLIYISGDIDSSGEVEWFAQHEMDEGSGVDQVTLEGNSAHGTATFVSSGGRGPVSGSFEVICAND